MLPLRRLLLLGVLAAALAPSCAQRPEDECLAYYLNIRMTCAVPMERRSGVSLAECKSLCFVNLDRCRSFQYDSVERQCDVFAIENPLLTPKPTTRSPAFAIPLKDHAESPLGVKKLRSRRAIVGTAHVSEVPVGPGLTEEFLPNDYCEPTMIPSIGVTFMVPRRSCRQRQVEAAPARLFGPPPNPFGPPTMSSPVVPAFANLPECPDASRPLIQLIEGVEVPGQAPGEELTLRSPADCLFVCQTRQRSRDPCQSATFDRATGTCTLLSDAIDPNGELQYTPNVNVVYFEKMCISEVQALVRCADMAHRVPQHILVGHASEILSASTQLECIKFCITAQTRLGFECRSILFFFEFPNDNCILNRQTRTSRPDFFIPERRQKVDYVQLPACWTSPGESLVTRSLTMDLAWQREDSKSLKTKPTTASEWSRWTKCDSQAHLQSRSRNCSNCVGGDQEVTPCVPEKQFESEFGHLFEEQQKTESGQRFVEQDNTVLGLQKPLNLAKSTKQIDGELDGLNQKLISSFVCDPVIECCPIIDEDTLRPDCSRGYRIASNHREESCFPEHCSWNPATQKLQSD
ncbi:hypothetical protein QR680_017161 [Steinernema hermaphroditum]|uniref:Apple domain-containing protein n=1 Tax=Steinernema hermaphroditum TaxID=289476 RepID=A0AA39HEQ3_9BILA|nr:hypothetical protein QR680_017161 [Steinernema hermaphroditum]